MQQQPNPDSLIRLIRASMDDLRHRAERGERVDMTALSRDIGALCEQLAVLPANDARPYADELEDLVVDLNGLEARLKETHRELTHRLEALSPAEGDQS